MTEPEEALTYHHADVFSGTPYSGNSVSVFSDGRGLTTAQMRTITKEMRHFESVFLLPVLEGRLVRARVFDLQGELDFAGHPILGAAAVLHQNLDAKSPATWSFELNAKTVQVATERQSDGFRAEIDQGRPEFLGHVPVERRVEFAAALGLAPEDVSTMLPLEVVSTGLRYLIVPVDRGLDRARIAYRRFDEMLATVGAQFAYLLDVSTLEGRHWNNDGVVEDIATGSAAGTVGAYLVKHGRIAPGTEFLLHQGRFVGRPSEIRVRVRGRPDDIDGVTVGGDVAIVGRGWLEELPR